MLGLLYYSEGRYSEAADNFEKAFRFAEMHNKERGVPVRHPPDDYIRLGLVNQAMGKLSKALTLFSHASETQNELTSRMLFSGAGEKEKMDLMDQLNYQMDFIISLNVNSAPTSARASYLAMDAVLRRKGRVLSWLSTGLPQVLEKLKINDNVLFQKYSDAISKLRTTEEGQANQTALRSLEEDSSSYNELIRIINEITRRHPELLTLTAPESAKRLQRYLPADAAAVEFAVYRPFNVKAKANAARWSEPHYIAYVLHKHGAPQQIDLGEVGPINEIVDLIRVQLLDDKIPERDIKDSAGLLNELVMQRVRRLLKGKRNIFISPDGQLNLVPFSALVDERKEYLIKRFSFTYLSSTLDLLRVRSNKPSRQCPVIFAYPAFNSPGNFSEEPGDPASATVEEGSAPSRLPREIKDLKFDSNSISHTLDEATAVSEAMGNAKTLVSEYATEKALKALKGPSVLHIATHAFFKGQSSGTIQTDWLTLWQRLFILSSVIRTQRSTDENPMLRSGIALAGANLRESASGQDGIATALEISRRDLQGTKLVVLSACDTGVGDVRNGEGVLSLRRALVLAGAESQVSSLWQVSDKSTETLVADYYKGIRSGRGRSSALRLAQLRLLNSSKWKHPYHWAAFTASGNWSAIKSDVFTTKCGPGS